MLDLAANPIFQRAPDAAQQEIKHRTTLRRSADKRRMVSAMQARNAVRDIASLPERGESVHVVARGNFPLWSIVPATLAMASPAIIEHLAVATLGFSKSNAADLLAMFDSSTLKAVDIVASVYFERQNPDEYRMMAEGLKERGQRMAAIRSHAKIITIALSDGRRFTVESSANLRSCRNLEQFTFTQAADLHDFHAGWIREAIDAALSEDKSR